MSALQPAVFLDRDGVINKEVHHLHKIEDLRLLPGVALAIRHFHEKGYRVILVTNQPVIARGMATHETVRAIHKELEKRLQRQGATIDAIYYCPHHPEGSIAEYAITCTCRKPETGLVEQAVREHGIDLARSFFIGDQTRDVLTGKKSGLKTILVKTGYGGSDKRYEVTPDLVANNLLDAEKRHVAAC